MYVGILPTQQQVCWSTKFLGPHQQIVSSRIYQGGRANCIKNWHFLQIQREKLAFFGVNLILQKFCPCKKNDIYKVCCFRVSGLCLQASVWPILSRKLIWPTDDWLRHHQVKERLTLRTFTLLPSGKLCVCGYKKSGKSWFAHFELSCWWSV